MTGFKVEKTGEDFNVHFKNPHINRVITCPQERFNQLYHSKFYYASAETQLRYHPPVLVATNKWNKCHELLLKRIWDSLWTEGWRTKTKF